MLACPLAGWVGATSGLGTALVALSALALLGVLAAWRAWPTHDPEVVPHDHLDLASDHLHWEANAVDDAATGHAHACVIDETPTRWQA